MAYTGDKKREYQRIWIAKRRSDFFKNKTCAWCNTTDNLVLHHLDPSQKESHSIWSWSKERRDKELEKCIIVCEKEHIEYHSNLRRLKDYHGTHTGYVNYKCRCDECKAAHAEVNRRYYQGMRMVSTRDKAA